MLILRALRWDGTPAGQAPQSAREIEDAHVGSSQHYPEWPNLAAMMFGLARGWPARPMLRFHRDGAWHGVTWGDFAVRAASVARGLRAAGVSAGDRVLVVSESRPEVPIL
ncbi:MAG: AMP-binding protein, partial [Gemmatimonadaceae bacterium]|nr:AMP-binding protein [Acetobacteraceae bacterium]